MASLRLTHLYSCLTTRLTTLYNRQATLRRHHPRIH
jgi:hypothetical protein